MLCGPLVPAVHPAGHCCVPCLGSCCYCPLSAWAGAWWQRPLCPGGLCARRAAAAGSTHLLSSPRTARRPWAPAHRQAEEDSSSEKTLSVSMQTPMILHHSKKSGGEEKKPKLSKTPNICSLWFSHRFVIYLKEPEGKAQVKTTAPVQPFCSLTMLQELPGWMQFIVSATLKMFRALTQCLCVKCQLQTSQCNDSKKWELRCSTLSESLRF